MRVMVNGLEVVVDGVEELKEIVREFGHSANTRPSRADRQLGTEAGSNGGGSDAGSPSGDIAPTVAPPPPRATSDVPTHAKSELLRAFLRAGAAGVPSADIIRATGKGGKAIASALADVAKASGFTEQEAASAFEPARTANGKRAWTLTSNGLRRAREVLSMSP